MSWPAIAVSFIILLTVTSVDSIGASICSGLFSSFSTNTEVRSANEDLVLDFVQPEPVLSSVTTVSVSWMFVEETYDLDIGLQILCGHVNKTYHSDRWTGSKSFSTPTGVNCTIVACYRYFGYYFYKTQGPWLVKQQSGSTSSMTYSSSSVLPVFPSTAAVASIKTNGFPSISSDNSSHLPQSSQVLPSQIQPTVSRYEQLASSTSTSSYSSGDTSSEEESSYQSLNFDSILTTSFTSPSLSTISLNNLLSSSSPNYHSSFTSSKSSHKVSSTLPFSSSSSRTSSLQTSSQSTTTSVLNISPGSSNTISTDSLTSSSMFSSSLNTLLSSSLISLPSITISSYDIISQSSHSVDLSPTLILFTLTTSATIMTTSKSNISSTTGSSGATHSNVTASLSASSSVSVVPINGQGNNLSSEVVLAVVFSVVVTSILIVILLSIWSIVRRYLSKRKLKMNGDLEMDPHYHAGTTAIVLLEISPSPSLITILTEPLPITSSQLRYSTDSHCSRGRSANTTMEEELHYNNTSGGGDNVSSSDDSRTDSSYSSLLTREEEYGTNGDGRQPLERERPPQRNKTSPSVSSEGSCSDITVTVVEKTNHNNSNTNRILLGGGGEGTVLTKRQLILQDSSVGSSGDLTSDGSVAYYRYSISDDYNITLQDRSSSLNVVFV